MSESSDTIIKDGFPDGWFIQHRLDTDEALLCRPALTIGATCVCTRPRALSTYDWVPTAIQIARALSTHSEGKDEERVERLARRIGIPDAEMKIGKFWADRHGDKPMAVVVAMAVWTERDLAAAIRSTETPEGGDNG